MTKLETEPEELVNLLNLANDFRAKVGLDKLSKLPKARTHLPNQCIIAKAFNNKCSVIPIRSYDPNVTWGYIDFSSKKDRDTFQALTGVNTQPTSDEFTEGQNIYTSYMTKELNEIALDFDGWAYPQYIEDLKYDG